MKNLVIMAGGMSQRMGQDKVFLEFEGESFLERVYKNAKVSFDEIFISTDTKEHKEAIKKLPALKGIKDENIILDRHERCGPIGGICSVFESTEISKFAIIPTDVPNADMEVLLTLFEICKEKPCIYKRDDGELEKLVGAYPRQCYKAFKERLEIKRFSIMKALESSGYEAYSKPELININPSLLNSDLEFAFRNINRPEDYKNLIGNKELI